MSNSVLLFARFMVILFVYKKFRIILEDNIFQMKKIFTIILLFTLFDAKAQVGIGTKTPNSTAALDITDTTKGILIPRMKMSNRLAISNPGVGLMVYQTDSTSGYWYYDGTHWNVVNYSNSTTIGGGKTYLTFYGNITDSAAKVKISNDLGINTQIIRSSSCSNLSSLDILRREL